jgi:hypothetical protein
MWKKLISMTLVIAFISLFTFNSVEAGSNHHHNNMWNEAGIALGALALGAMTYQLFTHPSPLPPPAYIPGHWETTREWVPGSRERVWVPGYYDRWGRPLRGHYEQRQIPGYYAERRVWVEGYYH